MIDSGKIILLMRQNSYSGREYLTSLMLAGIKVDVLYYGEFPIFNEIEDDRCGGVWNPTSFEKLKIYFNCYYFESINNKESILFLKDKKYDLGIQGGVGVLGNEIIECFSTGIINIHPGDLPYYRGCSAPEWQIIEKRPVISTCHIIDKGVDTGPIYSKKQLNLDTDNYYRMRSQIYPMQAEYLVETLDSIDELQSFKNRLTIQDEGSACYRKYIGDDIINKMKSSLPL